MNAAMEQILYYEKLIKIKKATKSELSPNEVNNWHLCRTCLSPTSEDDVDLGNNCVMDLQAGHILNVKEFLRSLAKLVLSEQEADLPLKLCPECLDKIKTVYYFTIQIGKAENVLKLLSHQLKTDNSYDFTLIKSEETPITEEFLFITEENSQSIEVVQNANLAIEEISDVEFLSSSGQNIVKEEQELVIYDVYQVNENLQLEDVKNIIKAEGDQLYNVDNDKEIQYSNDNKSTILKTNLNKKLYEKLPIILDNKCTVCQEIFNYGSDLVDHAHRCHLETKAFKCRNCSAVLSQISALYRHNKQNHTNLLSRNFKKKVRKPILIFYDNKCAVCKEIFNTKLDLVEHAKQFHPKAKAFKCRVCTMISSNMYYLCQHYKKKHQNLHNKRIRNRTRKRTRKSQIKPSEYFDNKCAVCHKIFYNKMEFIEHGKQMHPKVKAFKCRDCSMHFSYMKSLILHNRAIHKKNLIRKNHICEICSQSCYSSSDLRIHYRIHTGERPYDCPLCDWSFSMKSSLKGHLKTHERKPKQKRAPLICKYCFKILKTPSLLREHIKVHTDERPFKCAVCDRGFRNRKGMRDHHDRAHLKRAKVRGKYKHKEVTNLIDENDKIIIENQCAVCSEVFKSQRHLMEHGNEMHPNIKVFKCNLCEDVFADKLGLTNHINRHHRIWHKKHSCELCSKSFFSQYDLKSHIMVHTGERPYACSLCDKSYTKKITLRWHQKKVHSSKEANNYGYKCELCFKNFKNILIFKRHLRVHTGESAKTCSLWEKSFDIIRPLKTLLEEEKSNIVEDTPKPYKCDQCDRGFLSKSGLAKHSYKYHPPTTSKNKLPNTNVKKESSSLKSCQEFDPTKLQCDKCQKVFKFISGFNKHKNLCKFSKKHKKMRKNLLPTNESEDNLCSTSKDSSYFNYTESNQVLEADESLLLLKDIKQENMNLTNASDNQEYFKSDNSLDILSNASAFSPQPQSLQKYECEQCYRIFKSQENYLDHKKTLHDTRRSIRPKLKQVIYKEL